ncbi:MAG: UDP-N-acetyl-D-mannosamine dehydrogenase, partial [Bacteriovoracaceae bacterium]|nr:UDP-N-acetyl-D-mannosamine dehydrogenase [Bacteriovoracaceae bacterium]
MIDNVCVVGLGYMGLPMAAIVANAGISVIGVDLNKEKVDSVNRGECPFDEKGMPALVKQAVNNGMTAQTELPKASVYIVSVPTPVKDRKCDLTYVLKACDDIAEVADHGALIIIESTIKPNTCKKYVKPLFDTRNKDVLIAHCPERAIPGNTIAELTDNDRIIGGLTDEATQKTY